MFTELHGEEKREGVVRGDWNEMRWDQKRERASYPVITSLCMHHSLDRSEMFTELHREEEMEEGDRGNQEEKRGNQKWRAHASQ